MATLYWGGGTGTWDGFTTINWYSNVGRTVLAGRAPAADDDVVFDTASGTTYTVTVSNNTAVCRDLNYTGASGSFTLNLSSTLSIYGSVIFTVGGTSIVTGSAAVNFYGTGNHTINDAGFGLSTNTFAGSGTYTLLRSANFGSLVINNGIVNTNDYDIFVTADISGSGGTLNLGASNVSAGTIGSTGLTINGGTSNITLSAANANIGGDSTYTGNTFYNVTFSSTALGACAIYGNNTFNNLTFTTPTAASLNTVTLYNNNTINGTLTIAGQSGPNRYFVRSDTIGTTRTLTVASVATFTDVDFRDITVAGASAPWSGTRLGDCKGNTNITFGAGTNKYLVASGQWSGNVWAASSGGTASLTNFPLAQDTVVVDNAAIAGGQVSTVNIGYNIGGLNASARTTTLSFQGSGVTPTFYGSVILGSGISSTMSNIWTYAGRNTQTITSVGKSWVAMVIDSPGGTVQLVDAFSCSTTPSITLNNGTFDSNNKNITYVGAIGATGTAPKTLTLGSSVLSSSIGGVGSSAVVSNLTVTSNTATITTSSTTTLGFNGITASFGAVTTSSTAQAITVYGNTTVASLTISAAVLGPFVYNRLILGGNLTVTGTLALAGSSTITNRAFLRSDTIGTQRTLSAATVSGLTNFDIRDINATGAANWITGTFLGDCGGNSGITFPAAKTVYRNLGGASNWSANGWATTSGGTVAVNNFPLAQDTTVFNEAGLMSTVTIDAPWNIGTINAVSRTSSLIFAGSNLPIIYGDVTYGSGVTSSIGGTVTFSGRGTQTFTTAGKSINFNLTVSKPTGTFQHGDAYTSAQLVTVTLGAYATQNFTLSILGFSSNNTNTRSITLGTSTVTATGTTPVTFTQSSGLTFSGSSSTINMSSTSAKTFDGGGNAFGTVSSTGGTTAALTIAGSNTFGTLTNSARTYLIFTSGSTQLVSTFTYSGISGSVVRWYTSIPGQRATIKTPNLTPATLAVGTNSTNGGNNSNLAFTGSSPNYFYVKDIAYSVTTLSTGNFLMFFNGA
jgi:hypothetical protein